MKEIKIGIDFSINSSAVCILENNEYKFISFPRGIKQELKETFEKSNVVIKTVPKETLTSKILADKERFNSVDADLLINEISYYLSPFLNDNTQIGIEGIAFMARGNSIAQVAGYHYLLRYLIARKLKYDNIYLYAPNSVKKVAGKGNFKKHQMIDAFKNSTDELLIKNKFHQSFINTPELYQTRKGNFLKPVDDIVDAYWVLQTLIQSMCQ